MGRDSPLGIAMGHFGHVYSSLNINDICYLSLTRSSTAGFDLDWRARAVTISSYIVRTCRVLARRRRDKGVMCSKLHPNLLFGWSVGLCVGTIARVASRAQVDIHIILPDWPRVYVTLSVAMGSSHPELHFRTYSGGSCMGIIWNRLP
jgi:hypothetical protein